MDDFLFGDKPAVSILIPSYRGAARLARLFASMRSHMPSVRILSTTFEVLVRDDGSPEVDRESTREVVEKAGLNAKFIAGHNVGWPTGINVLVGESCGRDVLLLDDDVLVPKDLLFVFRTLLALPDVGVLSWRSFGDQPGQSKNARPGLLQPATQIAGYCMAFKREVYDEVGGLDERFRFYCSDSDFALRVALAGHPCYRVWWPLVPHEEHGCFKDAPELDRRVLAERDLAAFTTKWSADGAEMERRALAFLANP